MNQQPDCCTIRQIMAQTQGTLASEQFSLLARACADHVANCCYCQEWIAVLPPLVLIEPLLKE